METKIGPKPPAPPPVVRGRPANGGTPAAHSTPKGPSRMTLAGITRGKVVQPRRVLGYGHEASGKSSFGATSDSPVFLCAEDGTANLNIIRLPEPQTWEEVFEALNLLRTPELADRKTLVVDTLDWLEPLVWAEILKRNPKATSIEEVGGGWGKGYTAALEEWRKFIAALERLKRERGMWIVLLAHAHVKNFKNPESDDYDRWQLKLNEKASGLFKEWCDEVLFMRLQTYTWKETEKGKAKGVSSGLRIMHTARTAAYDAKNRCNLPEEIDYTNIGWKAYADAVAANINTDPLANANGTSATTETNKEGA